MFIVSSVLSGKFDFSVFFVTKYHMFLKHKLVYVICINISCEITHLKDDSKPLCLSEVCFRVNHYAVNDRFFSDTPLLKYMGHRVLVSQVSN